MIVQVAQSRSIALQAATSAFASDPAFYGKSAHWAMLHRVASVTWFTQQEQARNY
jgi:hypothetical protein